MDLSGITSNLTKNANKLGILAGILTGSPRGLEDLLSSITNVASGQIHIPDVRALAGWATGSPYLKQAIMLYIGGLVLDELNVPGIGKYGKAIQNGAVGYALGSFANRALWLSTHADQGSDPTKPGYNPYSSSGGGAKPGYSY